MCGIAGFISQNKNAFNSEVTEWNLAAMSKLISHRGPDGDGIWVDPENRGGFAHQRLSIIDLSNKASQPMTSKSGNVIVFNGEIYNHKSLRVVAESKGYNFRSTSDTEVIQAMYEIFGLEFVDHLRGMFAIAIWDAANQKLVLARDRFGIKPLYYSLSGGTLVFASEIKAILPWLDSIETEASALAEYLTFQYTIGGQTLFRNVHAIEPGNIAVFDELGFNAKKYWDVSYEVDFGLNEQSVITELRALLEDSVSAHMESDVEIGAYVSGGVDSALIASIANKHMGSPIKTFHGRFTDYSGYDESLYASQASKNLGSELEILDITSVDFVESIEKVIYHLDTPVAGPGSFPQFMVSKLAAEKVKVVLGGQGGDEIFGGYARYLVAYLEQALKAAIEGTYSNGSFVVTLGSMIPNLESLKEYKPLIQSFWSKGLFGSLDKRFFTLINRSADMQDEIRWQDLDIASVEGKFSQIFNNPENVRKEAYFDKMTHFEFKTLLPALLQVEDRMSMAHGLESRVPFLDHKLIEFMATVPADIKFRNGNLKHLLRSSFHSEIPASIFNRKDKMGFPVPLQEWFSGPIKPFIEDIMSDIGSHKRDFLNPDVIRSNFAETARYSRKMWALVSLELWQQMFHDKSPYWKSLIRR